MTRIKRQNSSKPEAILGAGQLVSTVWNTADQIGKGRCRFNIYRLSPSNGRVSQLLRPADVLDLVKLCQVLAVTLADDATIALKQREALADLAIRLDQITRMKD